MISESEKSFIIEFHKYNLNYGRQETIKWLKEIMIKDKEMNNLIRSLFGKIQNKDTNKEIEIFSNETRNKLKGEDNGHEKTWTMYWRATKGRPSI